MLQLDSKVTLSNGLEMPILGLGVWRAKDPAELLPAIKDAVEAGYRMIDTARAYGNEPVVGEGLQACGLSRDQIFLTTKLKNEDQQAGYDAVMYAFEDSLRSLRTDYVDLYLMHWPVMTGRRYVDAWNTMIELYRAGRVRAIGVCNCTEEQLEVLAQETEMRPMVDQIECHPLLSRVDLRAYCRKNGIQFESYSPLMRGQIDLAPELYTIAERYGKTPAQVILRWHLQNGAVIIPKSVHKNRILENCDLFDFVLSGEDMARIDGMNRNQRLLGDPPNLEKNIRPYR